MEVITEQNKSAQKQPAYDVIISGAGPVGLFLGCELALAECSVLILEKADDPGSPLKQVPFGIRGLSAPTIETLYRRDLLSDLELHKRIKATQKAPTAGLTSQPRRLGGHFAGIPFLDSNIDQSQWEYRLSSSTDASMISEMQEIETALTRRAGYLGVEIKRGFPVTDFHQDDESVTITSGDHSYIAKWLVGCDGARSVVRKKSNIEFAGTEPEFTGYSTLVDLTDPEKLSPGRNVTATGMYMQSQPGYIVIQDFDGGAFHDAGKPVTVERVQEVLRRVSNTDVTVSALHTATTWTDRARQSTTYRNGRVLLAGDAAHIHAPLGGQGLNLGLGDAMNLGWKLAATIKRQMPESLLDSYYNERYPVGVQVLDWSRAQAAVMKPSQEGRALNAIFRDLMDTPDGATYFAARVWGINTHYNLGGNHTLTGRSVPNFEFEDGTTIGRLMRDGLGILLDFSGNDSLKSLAEDYAGRITYISGHAKEQLGLSAVLIRPDGFVAWAASSDTDIEEAKQAAAQWFA